MSRWPHFIAGIALTFTGGTLFDKPGFAFTAIGLVVAGVVLQWSFWYRPNG